MKLNPEEKKIICDFFELMFSKIEEITDKGTPLPPDPAKPQNRLIPVAQWNKHHDWPTVPGLRHPIFYEHQNGFHQCIRRAGRRILIDEKAFFDWLNGKPH